MAALAWNQYQVIIQLRSQLLDADQQAALQKRLADLEKGNHALQEENIALRARTATAGVKMLGDENGGDGIPKNARNTNSATSDISALQLTPAQLQAVVSTRYEALFKLLSLTPAQAEQLGNLLTIRQQAIIDSVNMLLQQGEAPRGNMPQFRQAVAEAQGSVDGQIAGLIGSAAYAQFQQYEQTTPARNTVAQFQQELNNASIPLSQEQADQMVQLVTQTGAVVGGNGLGSLIYGNMNTHTRITDQTISTASGVLTPSQVQMLQQFQHQQ